MKRLTLAFVLVVGMAAAAQAAEQLTPKQMDGVTAGAVLQSNFWARFALALGAGATATNSNTVIQIGN